MCQEKPLPDAVATAAKAVQEELGLTDAEIKAIVDHLYAIAHNITEKLFNDVLK